MKFDDPKGDVGLDSKNFIRLKDKETVKGVFRGDVFKLYTHWNGKHSEECRKDFGESCQYCSSGDRPKFRFRLNFFLQNNNGSFTPKIFEQGKTVYDLLSSLHGVDYDLEKTIVRISRIGSGLDDTQYTIIPLPNGMLTVGQEKDILSQKLFDLSITPSVSQESELRTKTLAPIEQGQDDVPF